MARNPALAILAIAEGWLWLHEGGTYVKFTDTGRAAVCGTVMDGLGTGRSSPKPPLPRDIALSAAASAQSGPLVAVGTRRACGGEANQQTDSALGRLCRVPLVPRHGA